MSKHLQSRARVHINQAKLFGWSEKHLICDYALAALVAEGHDADNAATAVEVVWARLEAGG
jgi:hypothetical protein